PPGPKGYPVVGNLFDLPTHKAWLAFDRMFKTYGDMIYLNVLGQSFLILGNPKVIGDLFELRSKNYSDRIRSLMLFEFMGWDYNLALLPYGSGWRDRRR
ncbi:hypothetical protein AGABI2DRAFT_45037, partial [Agaricus bisporus var. bisporus H97]|uniref:hypothetical protein n=1 Tax=Agaricus bisporus var. bisporus (strain H97 / ATCC MYA-4626 / FGSC 10389) TaxID=936046 RepID=UPI00029F67F7